MLTYFGFKAWLTFTDGLPLPEFGIQVSEEKHIVTCYVASEPGRRFSVRWRNLSHLTDTIGDVFIDGSPVGTLGIALHRMLIVTAIKSDVVTSADTGRPFVFGDACEGNYDSDDESEVGEIKIVLSTAKMGQRADYQGPKIKDKVDPTKRRVKFAKAEACRQPPMRVALRQERVATFIFKYRPREALLRKTFVTLLPADPMSLERARLIDNSGTKASATHPCAIMAAGMLPLPPPPPAKQGEDQKAQTDDAVTVGMKAYNQGLSSTAKKQNILPPPKLAGKVVLTPGLADDLSSTSTPTAAAASAASPSSVIPSKESSSSSLASTCLQVLDTPQTPPTVVNPAPAVTTSVPSLSTKPITLPDVSDDEPSGSRVTPPPARPATSLPSPPVSQPTALPSPPASQSTASPIQPTLISPPSPHEAFPVFPPDPDPNPNTIVPLFLPSPAATVPDTPSKLPSTPTGKPASQVVKSILVTPTSNTSNSSPPSSAVPNAHGDDDEDDNEGEDDEESETTDGSGDDYIPTSPRKPRGPGRRKRAIINLNGKVSTGKRGRGRPKKVHFEPTAASQSESDAKDKEEGEGEVCKDEEEVDDMVIVKSEFVPPVLYPVPNMADNGTVEAVKKLAAMWNSPVDAPVPMVVDGASAAAAATGSAKNGQAEVITPAPKDCVSAEAEKSVPTGGAEVQAMVVDLPTSQAVEPIHNPEPTKLDDKPAMEERSKSSGKKRKAKPESESEGAGSKSSSAEDSKSGSDDDGSDSESDAGFDPKLLLALLSQVKKLGSKKSSKSKRKHGEEDNEHKAKKRRKEKVKVKEEKEKEKKKERKSKKVKS